MTTAINLIPYYRRNARIQRVNLRKWGFICSIYCMVATGIALVLMTQNNSNTTENLKLAISDADLEVEARVERVNGLQSRVNEAARLHAATKVQFPQPDWSMLLGVFNACGTDAILLDGCTLAPRAVGESKSNSRTVRILESPDAFAVNVSGWSESQKAVSDFLLSLERTGLFGDLTLTESTRQDFRSGAAIRFSIEATLLTSAAMGGTG